jgi:hypothetical protein
MGLLPNPEDPVASLVARFADMGFSVRDLMALIGAHTTGKQRFVDPTQANDTFDTTVDIWDTRFCERTLTFFPFGDKLSDPALSQIPRPTRPPLICLVCDAEFFQFKRA